MKFLNYKLGLFTLCFIILSCRQRITHKDIQKLNGYWEITLVESATKKIKKYATNTTVDYFSVDENGNGFRKKTKADFSGKYKANKIKDTLHVLFQDETVILQTVTPYDKWEETIVKLTGDELILKNDKGILFHYKKHQKYNLD